MPFRFDAATLSRIRSPVMKDSSMLRVSRPMLVVVLKAWVTEMKETQCASNSSTSLAKSASDRVGRLRRFRAGSGWGGGGRAWRARGGKGT